ncbi:myotubularin-related 2-like isoform X3 [Paramuricea clavata]|uniref:Myotubularin-related 2-like isoform X3 n=1 Tax=Paramuricea clavata TaxID=317549 RepID=A0A6S7GW85_PARCT|nr:myotubularin-related 2-like isoform X3 [Paramuricea clavata]
MFYRSMPINTNKDSSNDLSGSLTEDLNHISKTSSTKAMPARLIVGVIAGRNLISMDVGGKSDPYCIISVGEEEAKTLVQYNTVDPQWNASFSFSLYNGPHFKSSGSDGVEDSDADQCIIHYVVVDIWDKDTLNRDDFMGRVMVPVSLLTHESFCGWIPLGRTSPRDAQFTGEIYLELRIKSQLPITRWNADDQLYNYCDELTDFNLPIQGKSAVLSFPGQTERVEMVLENVVIEISKHRDVGTVYLTNYRLVIICKSGDKVSEDHSMWIAFKNIQSVDKAVDEKAVRRSLSGNCRISIVKCLTIECCDFRKIRLTFVDVSQAAQPSISLTETLKQSLLIPEFNPKRGEFVSQQKGSVVSSAPKFDVLRGNDGEDGDSWSLCEDDDVEEGEELNTNEGIKPIPSSPRVMKRSFSPLSSLGDLGRLLVNIQGAFSPNCANTPPDESPLKDDNDEVSNQKSFIQEYVNWLHVRLSYLIVSVTETSLSKEFVRAFPQSSSCGWDVYNVKDEFQRQEIDENWRMSEMNTDYETCHSYPRFFYVPAGVEDGILRKCADFRSKGRLPVLCWFNKKRGNFIMRCAQPRTGPRKKFSADDEYVIQTALASNTASRSLVIFDARSVIAASGNQLKGKGTEDIDRYPGCKLTFLNIPNIHAVRDSLEKLQTACQTSERKWFSQLEASGWMAYIALILQGAISIVRHVDEKGVAALIHCSDGWDRTAQLSALAQILLDSFYRTIKGFQVLIEKEWISFGHRFRDRNGHPSSNSNQRSPIFVQFLDCVWQILIQFPSSFEFTAEYLLRIVDHVNTGWFGTFMCNNEKQRNEEAKSLSTISLWAHLDNIREVFQNENYIPDDEVLHPTSSLRRLPLWSDYYLRYDETFWAANQLFDYGQQTDTDEVKSSCN